MEYQRERLQCLLKLRQRRQGVHSKALCFTILDNEIAKLLDTQDKKRAENPDDFEDYADDSKIQNAEYRNSKDALAVEELTKFESKTRRLFNVLQVIQEAFQCNPLGYRNPYTYFGNAQAAGRDGVTDRTGGEPSGIRTEDE